MSINVQGKINRQGTIDKIWNSKNSAIHNPL